MYKFSKTSQSRLNTCHPDLIIICNELIKVLDLTIVCGERGKEEQEAAFKSGNSKAHFGQSPHNFSPSRAIDIAPYNNGIDWEDDKAFKAMADKFLEIAEKFGIEITWGGNFKSFSDTPHFELKNWKSLNPN